jgi:8-hydroxy-5-deazaflavin:NADPH oxidoreductase
MRIGIVGKGNVAGCLGPLWGARGHEVIYGVRDTAHPEVKGLVSLSGVSARAVTVPELGRLTDVILLSVRWNDVMAVLGELGPLRGKTLIDCITPMSKGKDRLLIGLETSAAEQIAAAAPEASVVKAFDTAGIQTMKNPVYGRDRAIVFTCGDDAAAKAVVKTLATDLGFDVRDAGGLKVARYLEPLAMLWVHLAFFGDTGKDFGFKLLHRESAPDENATITTAGGSA